MHRSVAFLLFMAMTGCAGADARNELLDRRANQPGASGDVAATDPTSGDGTTTSEDAGAAEPVSNAPAADSSTGTPSSDPFAGAPAYVAQNGPNTIKGDHPFAGGNPAKQSCLQSQCHGPGGEGPRFIAGGTVYEDIAGTMPAAQIEVRIRDANGDARIARTDMNGNFYFSAGNSTVDFPARTGARDATNARTMAAAIANGDCSSSSCHGGAQGVIHVP
jgi:hypothetical protein